MSNQQFVHTKVNYTRFLAYGRIQMNTVYFENCFNPKIRSVTVVNFLYKMTKF